MGHGSCVSGRCVCDSGYILGATTCVPNTPRPMEVREAFNDEILPTRWAAITGGETTLSNPCGGMLADKMVFFMHSGGLRRLTTTDLDARAARYIQFIIQIGDNTWDGTSTACTDTSTASEGVVVAYSLDGGVTWKVMSRLPYSNYRTARQVRCPNKPGPVQ